MQKDAYTQEFENKDPLTIAEINALSVKLPMELLQFIFIPSFSANCINGSKLEESMM